MVLLISTFKPRARGAISDVTPSRSPFCGAGLPDLDTRATTTTLSNADSFIVGLIALESSRENCTGNSRTVLRMMASGMRGPEVALAYIKTVSSGFAFDLSAGARLTVPCNDAAPVWAASFFALD